MKFKVPHTYVLLFMVIIVCAIASYIVPAGVYDRVKDPDTGRTIVDPGSFHRVDQTPVGIFDIFLSIPKGMKAASEIIFFIFIVGGAFGIIQATGFVEASIGRAVLSLEGKEKLLIPLTMAIFSIGGATFGMAEETLVFVPIGIALARALGFDTITGTAMVALGAASGFTGGWMNPFTVGVAQGIADLPLFSGFGFRFIAYLVILGTAIVYVTRYAMMVKKDPTKSPVYDLEQTSTHKIDLSAIPQYTARHTGVLIVMILGFATLIYGVFKLGWYITELSGIFIAMAVVAGLVGGLGVNDIGNQFVKGAGSLVFGALVVGVARGILIVLTEGQIIDTIIHAMASAIQNLPTVLSAVGMYVVQVIINTFIPSGSGQAATTMPIMIPVADLVGITRQTAVLAFGYGDGFTNSIIPTSAVLMAYLAIGGIPYDRWVRWIAPLMGLWLLIGGIFVTIATLINYGPF